MKNVRKHSFYLSISVVVLFSILTNAQWVQTNGPQSGSVRALVSDGERIYAGVSSGGVYVSTNNGINWERRNTGLNQFGVISLLVKDNYVFTGLISGGIFVSTNHGESWEPRNNGLPYTSVSILAKADSFIYVGMSNSFYRSSNNGLNWYPINNGLTNRNIIAFIYKDSICFAGTENGIFISSDFGDSWIERSDGLSNKEISDFEIIGNTIFAYTLDGVFKKTNNDSLWFSSNSGLPITPTNSGKLCALDSVLFAGTFWYGMFISTDLGESWDSYNFNYPSGQLTYDLLTKDNTIYAGLTSGIHANKYPQLDWEVMNSNILGANIGVLITKEDLIIAGGMDGKIFISSDKGVAWNAREITGSFLSVGCMAFKGDSLFASVGSKLFVSTDFGLTWNQLNYFTSSITSIAIREGDVFIGTSGMNGIWKSTDGGYNWFQINEGLSSIYINALASDELNIYAGTVNGLFISSDNGNSWIEANINLTPSKSVQTIKIIGNYIYVGAIYGIYLSTNNGSTWAFKGLSNKMVTAIDGFEETVFAGTTPDGIYMSKNRGSQWSLRNNGLPYLYPLSLAIIDETLFSGIYGHSVWSNSTLITKVDEKELPTGFSLFQNYPNPFNPITIIKYSIPVVETGRAPSLRLITLKIYDILGNEISTLVNEEKHPGEYDVEFDGSKLSSGVYFYRLRVGSFIQTNKMVLTK
ncbi:MAG: T9SS type A sorting domain-containing protein [Ignavibacteria bacterium]|nr:T9SS type A sorting domain-containing protein [Ignavibacteria bacterium]